MTETARQARKVRMMPGNLFGEELDDRALFITLTTAGYTTTPLNLLEWATCSICSLSNVWAVAVIRKGTSGHVFRVCRSCGATTLMFDSQQA
jgi:hypothetical protein